MKNLNRHKTVRFAVLLPFMALAIAGCGKDSHQRRCEQDGSCKDHGSNALGLTALAATAQGDTDEAKTPKQTPNPTPTPKPAPSPTPTPTPSPTPNPAPTPNPGKQIVGSYVQKYDYATTLKIDDTFMVTTNLAITISTKASRVKLNLPNPLTWDSKNSIYSTTGTYTRSNGKVVPLTLTADSYASGNELDVTVITKVYDADTSHFTNEPDATTETLPVNAPIVTADGDAGYEVPAATAMDSLAVTCSPPAGGSGNCNPCPPPADTSREVSFPYNFIKP